MPLATAVWGRSSTRLVHEALSKRVLPSPIARLQRDQHQGFECLAPVGGEHGVAPACS